MRLITSLVAVGLLMPTVGLAQGAKPVTPQFMCGLVTKAQIEKLIGQKLYDEGEGMDLGGGGALCNWGGGDAQIMLFTGPKSETNWEGMLKSFKQEKTPRHPVPGLGGPAYVIYPPTKNEYQSVVAMVVVKMGQNTLVVSTAVKKGEPAEKALGPTVELAKLVMPKVK